MFRECPKKQQELDNIQLDKESLGRSLKDTMTVQLEHLRKVYQKDMDELKRQNHHLKSTMSEWQKNHVPKTRYEDLEKDLEFQMAEHTALQKTNKEMAKTIESLIRDKQTKSSDSVVLMTENKQLNDKIKNLLQLLQKKTEMQQTLEKEMNDLGEQWRKKESALSNLQHTYQCKVNHVTQLKLTIQDLKTKLDATEITDKNQTETLALVGQLRSELSKRNKEIQTLKPKMDILETKLKKLHELEQRIHEYEKEKQKQRDITKSLMERNRQLSESQKSPKCKDEVKPKKTVQVKHRAPLIISESKENVDMTDEESEILRRAKLLSEQLLNVNYELLE